MISNILLVDDDSDDVSLFQEALNQVNADINFHSASNGLQALELLASRTLTPDVIFLDINMPEMNGWRCLSELKSSPTLKQVPVIMYSTSATKADEQKAASAGALAIYQKPERFQDIKQLLSKVISDLV